MGLHCSGGDGLVKKAFGPSFELGFHSHLDYHSTIWILPQKTHLHRSPHIQTPSHSTVLGA